MLNVDFFGGELIKKVRDPAIEDMLSIVDGNVKPPSWIEYFNVIKDCTDEQKDTIKKMLIEAVDSSLLNFMGMLDENPETFSLIINTNENGRTVIHDEEDELQGRLFCWYEDYSGYDDY